MSNYTTYENKKISTWLDSAGALLDTERLKDETLFHYQQRLIDTMRNRASPSTFGLNNSAARQLGLERTHVFTLSSVYPNPYIKITSKYIYLYSNEVLDFKFDLYNNTFGDLKTYIDYNSSYFNIDYYDEDLENLNLKYLSYDNNLKGNSEVLGSSKCIILEKSNIKDIYFHSDSFLVEKDSIDEIENFGDFYIDYQYGIVYLSDNCSGKVTYNYYENPFKLFYSPVTFYPLADEDIDYLIKDTIYNGTEENLILNSKGAEIINKTLEVGPTTIGR